MTTQMQRSNRVKRSKQDLINELKDQIDILVCACNSFDSGLRPIAKHIALSLRTLLHHHGNSRALLEQLGLRNKRFLDTAGKIDPKNLATEWKLCVIRFSGDSSEFLPSCMVSPLHDRYGWVTFPDWWNSNVVKDNNGRFFSRRELVLNVADTDGGAHVDPELDEKYMDLSRNNSLGWVIINGDVEKPFPSPTMSCIRQIAHELLETLQVKAADQVKFNYQPIEDSKK